MSQTGGLEFTPLYFRRKRRATDELVIAQSSLLIAFHLLNRFFMPPDIPGGD
ncbi:MAG: hypothetical protein R3F46_13990 [bacterium]